MGLFDRLFGKKELSPSGAEILRYKWDGDRPLGFAKIPEEWAGIREEFYERHFGPIDIVHHEIVPKIPHIDVYQCKPHPDKGRNYYTYVTSGMSDLPMNVPKSAPIEMHRAELVIYVSEADVAQWKSEGLSFPEEFLRSIAVVPHLFRSWFGPMHTMPFDNPPKPILDGSLLTTALFLTPEHEPPYIRNGLKLDNNPVSFLWVVPITDAECELKLNKGGNAFSQIMRDNNLPIVLDMNRKSYI